MMTVEQLINHLQQVEDKQRVVSIDYITKRQTLLSYYDIDFEDHPDIEPVLLQIIEGEY